MSGTVRHRGSRFRHTSNSASSSPENSVFFNFGPYEASAGKIQANPDLDGPYSIRMILTFNCAWGELAPPASPPTRSVVEPPAAGFTM